MADYNPGDFDGDGDFDARDATIMDMLKEGEGKQSNSTKRWLLCNTVCF